MDVTERVPPDRPAASGAAESDPPGRVDGTPASPVRLRPPPPPPPEGIVVKLVVGMAAAAAVFLAVPEIDLWVSAPFHTPDRGFGFRYSELGLAYDAWRDVLLIAPLVAFLVWFLAQSRGGLPDLLERGREVAFVIVSMVVANGLVVNAIFKEMWGRARPHQTEIFGGTREFTPPLVPTDQCASNCSFVGGDMGFAFGMIALMLLARSHRGAWLAAVMAYAAVISLLRIAHGAHFLSDGVFAGLFTIAITIGVFHLFLGEGPRAHGLRRRTGLASLGTWIAERLARLVGPRPATAGSAGAEDTETAPRSAAQPAIEGRDR
jgi:lipid A 4'-phosphatase